VCGSDMEYSFPRSVEPLRLFCCLATAAAAVKGCVTACNLRVKVRLFSHYFGVRSFTNMKSSVFFHQLLLCFMRGKTRIMDHTTSVDGLLQIEKNGYWIR